MTLSDLKTLSKCLEAVRKFNGNDDAYYKARQLLDEEIYRNKS